MFYFSHPLDLRPIILPMPTQTKKKKLSDLDVWINLDLDFIIFFPSHFTSNELFYCSLTARYLSAQLLSSASPTPTQFPWSRSMRCLKIANISNYCDDTSFLLASLLNPAMCASVCEAVSRAVWARYVRISPSVAHSHLHQGVPMHAVCSVGPQYFNSCVPRGPQANWVEGVAFDLTSHNDHRKRRLNRVCFQVWSDFFPSVFRNS